MKITSWDKLNEVANDEFIDRNMFLSDAVEKALSDGRILDEGIPAKSHDIIYHALSQVDYDGISEVCMNSEVVNNCPDEMLVYASEKSDASPERIKAVIYLWLISVMHL